MMRKRFNHIQSDMTPGSTKTQAADRSGERASGGEQCWRCGKAIPVGQPIRTTVVGAVVHRDRCPK